METQSFEIVGLRDSSNGSVEGHVFIVTNVEPYHTVERMKLYHGWVSKITCNPLAEFPEDMEKKEVIAYINDDGTITEL